MGILDDAIREHLELKRQHGAEEKEIEGLESEAFGPADRPDAVEPETRILSPEEASGQTEPVPGIEPEPESEARPATDPGQIAEEAPAPEAAPVPEVPKPASAAEPAPVEPMPPADPVGATVPDIVGDPGPVDENLTDFEDEEGDAGDLLEAERHRLAGHPTEHYDVDAAIAEEDELDILSESSLSDELDRALESPAESVSREDAADPESDYEPLTADPPAEGAAEELEDAEYEAIMDTPADEDPPELPEEPELPPEDDSPEAETGSTADFFDQEDPLEGTPDFLEETPEHDRLWFEQREPKDFDFGD